MSKRRFAEIASAILGFILSALVLIFSSRPHFLEGLTSRIECSGLTADIVNMAFVVWCFGNVAWQEHESEPFDRARKWQYGLLAAGAIWAFGYSKFVPREVRLLSNEMPAIGFLAFAVTALIVGWVIRVRK
ncbi:hypothetical protein [Rhizomicrobium electricum]|nr:hypothetical protein [Rhizomicrobium electricum]NIJ47434.1 hypothetical protein [Rhizomicrobium electricum]